MDIKPSEKMSSLTAGGMFKEVQEVGVSLQSVNKFEGGECSLHEMLERARDFKKTRKQTQRSRKKQLSGGWLRLCHCYSYQAREQWKRPRSSGGCVALYALVWVVRHGSGRCQIISDGTN